MIFPEFLFQLLIFKMIKTVLVLKLNFLFSVLKMTTFCKTGPGSSATGVKVECIQVSVSTYSMTESIDILQISSLIFSVYSPLLHLAFHRDEMRCNVLPPGLLPSHGLSLL